MPDGSSKDKSSNPKAGSSKAGVVVDCIFCGETSKFRSKSLLSAEGLVGDLGGCGVSNSNALSRSSVGSTLAVGLGSSAKSKSKYSNVDCGFDAKAVVLAISSSSRDLQKSASRMVSSSPIS